VLSGAACSATSYVAREDGLAVSAPRCPYSFVARAGTGLHGLDARSWTRPGSARDDATAVHRPRAVDGCGRGSSPRASGRPGSGLVTSCDAGYDVTALAWVLRDLAGRLVAWSRSDR